MKRGGLIGLGLLVLIGGALFFLIAQGYFWFNNPSLSRFPIRGLDVSNHQGRIDWSKLKGSSWRFAYIKATEGQDFKDRCFSTNWEQARQAGITSGAYHYFTFRSSGAAQAANFIATVPRQAGSLPAAIDIEFGGNSRRIPDRTEFRKELAVLLETLEQHYQQRPILYVTYDSYQRYIAGDFSEYQIWIRDILKFPRLKSSHSWAFWQYSSYGRVAGVKGPVDCNVFNGSADAFARLIRTTLK